MLESSSASLARLLPSTPYASICTMAHGLPSVRGLVLYVDENDMCSTMAVAYAKKSAVVTTHPVLDQLGA